jgi:hypothetical protein
MPGVTSSRIPARLLTSKSLDRTRGGLRRRSAGKQMADRLTTTNSGELTCHIGAGDSGATVISASMAYRRRYARGDATGHRLAGLVRPSQGAAMR